MAKDYRRLWAGVTNTIDEAKAVRTLAEILVDKGGRTFISHLGPEDAGLCIEILDHGIALHNLKTAEKQVFFVTLRRLAGYHGRLPDSMIVTEKIEVSDEILASGGFADVRSGKYMGHLVAVKTVRVTAQDDFLKIRKQFCKEVVLWSTLSHPNVLGLVGVQGDMAKGQFITVSEWMTHGNVMEYIKNNYVNRLQLLYEAAQGLEYLHGAGLTHGDLKGANILMSNDTPPRACLADFGFMTMVLNSDHPMSCSVQLEGGTMTFMSPELLVPSKFDMENAMPTPEADIYAFSLVIFQVLMGEIPFRGVRHMELGYAVVEGLRPKKPENASTIGFSDSLWGFVQRCWDCDMKLRPKVTEVVKHLEKEATNWKGLMPPCVRVENVASNSTEMMSDSMKHNGIFQSSSGVVPGSPTDSQATSGPFTRPSTPSTQCSESPQEESQEVVTKPFDELPPEPPAPRLSRSDEPRPGPPASIRSRTEDTHEDSHIPESYPHLNQNYNPPPTQLPKKKRRGFRYFKAKFREFFHFRR